MIVDGFRARAHNRDMRRGHAGVCSGLTDGEGVREVGGECRNRMKTTATAGPANDQLEHSRAIDRPRAMGLGVGLF